MEVELEQYFIFSQEKIGIESVSIISFRNLSFIFVINMWRLYRFFV